MKLIYWVGCITVGFIAAKAIEVTVNLVSDKKSVKCESNTFMTTEEKKEG